MSGAGPTSVALFTRDLRVHDNPVLRAAVDDGGAVLPLFVVDDGIAELGFRSPNRAAFLADSLADLDRTLRERDGGLVVRSGDVVREVTRLAGQVDARRVHVAADVSRYAHRRAERLREALEPDGRELVVHESVVTVLAPGEVTPTGGKDHFAVFTPYHRRWAAVTPRTPLGAPRTVRLPAGVRAGPVPSAAELGATGTAPELMRGGETEARRRLSAWCRAVGRYDEEQDGLAVDGTSRLSPYLHLGCLSATEAAHRVGSGSSGGGSAGAAAFVRQLAWRDFHHQVLAARPDAARQDYRTHHDRWRTDRQALDAWKRGRTGVPIVDAGMRQLLAEGWMHNRARLIVGSFLAKTLYLDWRLGAEHFLAHLVDGDVANNQLNWQWVAGTGTDTRPNRVLNPLAQARRRDPEGDYVRRWVPELAGVAGRRVHEPWTLPADERDALDYPPPIVDLDEAHRAFHAARGR
jgi:deoxyribodipyrimidine photo-lyase